MNTEKPLLVKLVAQPAGTPEIDFPRPERRVAGNPERRTWNLVDEAIDYLLVAGYKKINNFEIGPYSN